MNRDDYAGIAVFITRRFFLVFMAGLVGLLIMGLYTYFLASPVYEGSVTLHISKIDDNQGYLNTDEFNVYNRMIADSEDMIKSRSIYQYMIDIADYKGSFEAFIDDISLEREVDSNVFSLKFNADNPERAAEYANVLSEKVIKVMEEEFVQAKVRLINPAFPKKHSVRPSIPVNLVVGFCIGILICSAILIMVYIFADFVKNESDIREIIKREPTIRLRTRSRICYRLMMRQKKKTGSGQLRLVSSLTNRLLQKLDKEKGNILIVTSADSSFETVMLPLLLGIDMKDKGRKPVILNFRDLPARFMKKGCNYTAVETVDFLNKKRIRDKILKIDKYPLPLFLDFVQEAPYQDNNGVMDIISITKEKERFSHIIVISGDVSSNDGSAVIKYPDANILFLVSEGETGKEELKSFCKILKEETADSADFVLYS